MKQTIKIATCQFAEDWNPSRNGSIICRHIERAAGMGAEVVHFHECALSGYGGKIAARDYPWDELARQAQRVCAAARRHGVYVIVGSSHQLTRPNKPHNSLSVISPSGKVIDRYDKRFCTESDLECYTAGNHFCVFKIKGLACSMLICFDLRFPELYRELARQGVRVIFQSFHNGRHTGPGIHRKIMRQTLQAHAGINAMWISAPNSSAYFSAWPGVFITPDGAIAGQLRHNQAGIMVNTIDPNIEYYDASKSYRMEAINGAMSNGKPVKDPRSEDRACW
jgi:predicted amidohydrolase